jgi:hypothetical protein
MSELESLSTLRRPAIESRPRHPQREIADLLATAIVRARIKGHIASEATAEDPDSEVCLGFTADQSVHTNPSYQEGVRQ